MWNRRKWGWMIVGFAGLLCSLSTRAFEMDGAESNAGADTPAETATASAPENSREPAQLVSAVGLSQQRNALLHYPQSTERMLQNKGFEFHGFLKTEASTDFHSGFTGDGTDTRSLLETSVMLDLDKFMQWKGGRVSASFHDYFGTNATNALVGDVQGFSNIDARPMNRIYELWFEQSFHRGKVRIKVGRIDANTEFAYVENAGDFLNSSMGYSPTILSMNTYPDLRTGGLVALRPWRSIFATLGDFRCAEHGNMAMGEVGSRWAVAQHSLPGRIAVGSWIHAHTRDGYLGQRMFGLNGLYVVAEQSLWRQESDKEDFRGVRAFAQWGNADPMFSAVSRHEGGGFEWVGPLARRPQDALGVGVTRVHLGADYYQADCTGRERSVESFYKVSVRKWWTVTPDLQLIDNAPTASSATRPYAATLRMVFSY